MGDIIGRPPAPREPADHIRVEAMVAMRDGVRLATLLLIPRDAAPAPILLIRTPYSIEDSLLNPEAAHAAQMLHLLPGELFAAGYIVAIQHVRGKHGSEGAYEMGCPVRGEWNESEADHVTDAWDTVEWLVQNVPQGNGRVAALGLSYDGFTALMHLVDPHAALAACVAISPMVDDWEGDDWFKNGVFHQQHALHYVNRQTRAKAVNTAWPSPAADEYEAWMAAGSAHGMARALGLDDLPAWQRFERHPAFDAFWQARSLSRRLAGCDRLVPTMLVHGQWDMDDAHGAIAAFEAIERSPAGGASNHLVSGPWSHGCAYFTDGETLGPLRHGGATAKQFRQQFLLPFLNAAVRDGCDAAPIAKISTLAAGEEEWSHFEAWPISNATKPFHLSAQGVLADEPAAAQGFDEYLSDPAKPCTHRPRPILRKDAPGFAWEQMGVLDQRFAGDRPDVLRLASPPLASALRLAGSPTVHLFASTSESDADWFVTLIDAWPADDSDMSDYQLPIARSAIRGRFIADRAQAQPLPSNQPVGFSLRLPSIAYTLRAGHRLMLHIQSSMFPAYDRNPQRFVPNIMFAEPEDYVKATHRIFHGADHPSRIELPIIG